VSIADELAAPDPEVEELRAAARRLSAQLDRERARTVALVDAVYQAARDAATIAGRAPTPRPLRDRRQRREEVALVHTTDWQAGKHNDTYDLDVLHRRIGQLADKVVSITDIQRADHPVRRCVVLVGGDMVEGVTVFPGQAWEIHAGLYEQLFRGARILEEFLVTLLAGFDEVEVFDIYGNHGRIGRRGDVPRGDNVDRIMYGIVAERFTNEPRLTWHHAPTWHHHVGIGAYTALLIHGDQIRSFGGNLPAYGILRKVNAWAAGVLDPFTDAFVGHFHTAQILNGADGRKVYMTGSPESGNEYAREFVAATGHPSQTLAFVDPDEGRVTSYYEIRLD
jgi:hypothetical protein